MIFIFYSDELVIDVETGIITKIFIFYSDELVIDVETGIIT
jgi:hypothetical protein